VFISISARAGTISGDENNIHRLDPSALISSVSDDITLKPETGNIGVVSVALARDYRFSSLRKENELSKSRKLLPIPAKFWVTGAILVGLIWIRRKFLTRSYLKKNIAIKF